MSNDLGKGAARVAHVRGENRRPEAKHGQGAVKFTVKKQVREDHVCPVIL